MKIGPDPYTYIRKQAIIDANKGLLDPLLYKEYQGYFPEERRYLAEDTYAYFYYKHLRMVVRNYKYKTSAMEAALIPANIYDAYSTVHDIPCHHMQHLQRLLLFRC